MTAGTATADKAFARLDRIRDRLSKAGHDDRLVERLVALEIKAFDRIVEIEGDRELGLRKLDLAIAAMRAAWLDDSQEFEMVVSARADLGRGGAS